MPSNKDLVLLGGVGILGFILLRNNGGISAFGGAGGTGGFGGFTDGGAGGGGLPTNIDGLETSQSVDGSQGTPIAINYYVPEPTTIPSPIPPANTIPSFSPNSPIGSQAAPANQIRRGGRGQRPTLFPADELNPFQSTKPRGQTRGSNTGTIVVTATSPLARSILTAPENQAPSTGAYQRFTPQVLREVHGIGINPFSERDPIDQGQNRYPNLPAFIGPTDSAVRQATAPELEARGISPRLINRRETIDAPTPQESLANQLFDRARRQTVQRPAPSTPTRQTGSPESRSSDRESSEANMGISNVNRVAPSPPAPTPTPDETVNRLRQFGIGINPFGRSGN